MLFVRGRHLQAASSSRVSGVCVQSRFLVCFVERLGRAVPDGIDIMCVVCSIYTLSINLFVCAGHIFMYIY